MSNKDYLPSKDADLAQWATNYDQLINLRPTDFGLTIELAAEFSVVNTSWQSAYSTAVTPETKGPSATQAKNSARKVMKAKARELAAIIRGHPGLTNQQRYDLGLTVPDEEPSVIPVPEFPPGIELLSASGTYVKIKLNDTQNPDTRGKPEDVDGASILTAFGSTPPLLSDVPAWTWQGNVTRTINTINFTGAPSGTTVWITAMWYNTKAQTGPPAQPISVQIPGQLPAQQTTEAELTLTDEEFSDAA